MNEIWMLDFLNTIIPAFGVFPSEGHAWAWVERHDPERKNLYHAFSIQVNNNLDETVYNTALFNRYRVQQ
jgi:hypothetical protein